MLAHLDSYPGTDAEAYASTVADTLLTGGPDHHTFWLSTIDADGQPHMTAVGAFWFGERCYFTGGPRSRKIRNLERDPRRALGVAVHGYDVALEGRATRVTDEALLHRLAQVFAEGGLAPTVADGGFTHDHSAASADPPWYVYEFTPEDAYAVMTTEPGGATRWTF
jgi:pyridoxamine 5'-phosphate oxidase-like protein